MDRCSQTRRRTPGLSRAPGRRTRNAAVLLLVLTASACMVGDTEEQPSGLVADDAEAAPAAAPRDSGAVSTRDLARSTASPEALEPVAEVWAGGDAQAGRETYVVHCATCHGAGGEGNGQASAALNPKPRDFTSGAFYFDGDADAQTGEPEDIARVILHGPRAFGGSDAMPAWRQVFTDDEVRDLVAYVRSFSGSGADPGA